ncbi:twin-arginine translocase TatA/TatE family subunit [Marihabitans asiaticum]|uniref:Sec-independent protein translocase protein TatB n=1 Tax=Marihabitans asiaticum TaxID=415218 RepID=A0A560WIH3_9MICO|nr:hypothetical protein [Marihabitans asiaticum]TWD17324.1 sec-independent protein translocase protein TatB [Marihabitans asiaticum]
MPTTGWEFIILVVLAYFLLGPDRLPDYAAKLARFVVQLRRLADDAKGQLKEQMGPDYEDVNWRQYDPRQYDPRKIVRQALLEPLDDTTASSRSADSRAVSTSSPATPTTVAHGTQPVEAEGAAPSSSAGAGRRSGPAPFDDEAT